MKNIILILVFAHAIVNVSGQSRITNSVGCPNWVYVGGTSADTLYASDTLAWSIRVSGADVQNMKMRLSITKVTGTVSDSVYFYGSFDGTTRDVAIDTIFNSNVSTGYKYATASRWLAFNYPYLIVYNVDKGGATNTVKSIRRLDIICRNE